MCPGRKRRRGLASQVTPQGRGCLSPHRAIAPPETHPNMAAVCRVFCWGGVEVLVDRRASLPAFSQSKASFSAMPRSFMLFSNTDMINCRGRGWREDRAVTPGASQEEGECAGVAEGKTGAFQDREGPRGGIGRRRAH